MSSVFALVLFQDIYKRVLEDVVGSIFLLFQSLFVLGIGCDIFRFGFTPVSSDCQLQHLLIPIPLLLLSLQSQVERVLTSSLTGLFEHALAVLLVILLDTLVEPFAFSHPLLKDLFSLSCCPPALLLESQAADFSADVRD